MTTGEIIQRERTCLGLSQEKLAEQVGVSRQAVSKWELGDAMPDTDKLVPLARALGIFLDTLLDYQPQQAEETPKEIEEKKPGWLALHWYWIGVPLILWGAARLIPVLFAILMVLNMAESSPGISTGIILYLPYFILFLAALVGGVLMVILGRRSVRRRYGLKPLTPPPWKGPRELIVRRWYWLGALVAGGGVLVGILRIYASQALYDQIEAYQQDLNMYQGDALREHIDQIPEWYLNGEAGFQVYIMRNQGLLILAAGVILGGILFFLGRWLVCRRWKENEEKFIAK